MKEGGREGGRSATVARSAIGHGDSEAGGHDLFAFSRGIEEDEEAGR